jgi:hypothetical protein
MMTWCDMILFVSQSIKDSVLDKALELTGQPERFDREVLVRVVFALDST